MSVLWDLKALGRVLEYLGCPRLGKCTSYTCLGGGDCFDESNQSHQVTGGRLELREGVSSKILSQYDLDV